MTGLRDSPSRARCSLRWSQTFAHSFSFLLLVIAWQILMVECLWIWSRLYIYWKRVTEFGHGVLSAFILGQKEVFCLKVFDLISFLRWPTTCTTGPRSSATSDGLFRPRTGSDAGTSSRRKTSSSSSRSRSSEEIGRKFQTSFRTGGRRKFTRGILVFLYQINKIT